MNIFNDFLKVPIGFGGAGLSGEGGGYGFGTVTEQQAETLIRAAIDLGVKVIDTAPIYGFGVSEERLGKYLKPSDNVFLITKGGVDWHDNGRVNKSNEPAVIEKMLNQSLIRLKRDCVDCYMLHWPDMNVDVRKPLEVLVNAQKQGKIIHIGLSNTNAEDLQKAKEMTTISVFQGEHNLWKRSAYELIRSDIANGFFTGWGTFDKGLLSGRVTKDRKFESVDARSWAPWWNKAEVAAKLDKVEKLTPILADHKLTLKEFSLLYVQKLFPNTCNLVGAKTQADLEGVIELSQKNISDEVLETIYTNWQKQITG